MAKTKIELRKAVVIDGQAYSNPKSAAKRWAQFAAYRILRPEYEAVVALFKNCRARSDAEYISRFKEYEVAAAAYDERLAKYTKRATKRALPIFTKLLSN